MFKKLKLHLIILCFGLFSFITPEANKTYQGLWKPTILPAGVTKVHDIEYAPGKGFANTKCYIATNSGLYMTDLTFEQHGTNWTKVSTLEFTDLQYLKETGGSKLHAWGNRARIGVIDMNNPTSLQRISVSNGRFWRSTSAEQESIAKVISRSYAVFNGNGSIQICSENGCNYIELFPNKVIHSFGYVKGNKFIMGGSSGRILSTNATGTNFKYASVVKSANSSHGKMIEVASSINSSVAYVASDKGYIYQSKTGGTSSSWKYYSHGLKPQDDPLTLYSMVSFRNYLYISTSRGLFYTSTTGTQADWKPLTGLPGWRNDKLKLYVTPTYLAVYNTNDNTLTRKKWF